MGQTIKPLFKTIYSVAVASCVALIASCGPAIRANGPAQSRSGQPSWVQGLREPLKELPRDEWSDAQQAHGDADINRVGVPRELGRLSDASAPSTRITTPIGDQTALSGTDPSGPTSALEAQYAGKLVDRPSRQLRQFGYDVIARHSAPVGSIEGASPNDHVLSAGDELIIDLTTDDVRRYRVIVAPDGTIAVEGLFSLRAEGLRFDAVREEIDREVARVRQNYQLSVGLGRLSAVPVRIVGEVEQPGVVQLGARPTLMDALGEAGVRKSGSLRTVTVIRSNGSREIIDLYAYFLGLDTPADVRLFRGDSIVVPPLGPTIGVAGSVQRPAIYELDPNAPSPQVSEAITLAGGGTGFDITDQLQVERTTDGVRLLLDVDLDQASLELQSGDLVLVGAVDGRLHPIVESVGELARPGRFQHRVGMRVSDLVRMSGGLTVDAFAGRVMISRLLGAGGGVEEAWDAGGMRTSRRVMVVDLARAMRGDPEHNIELEPLDLLRVHAYEEAGELPTIELIGAVRSPGMYELTAGMTLSDALALAMGLTPDAYREDIEIVRRRRADGATMLDVDRYRVPLSGVLDLSEQGPVLRSGDRIIVRRLSASEVRITASGMVRFPGEYVLPAGSTISDLIAAAGGVLPQGDLRAARFTRESVRRTQLARWEHLAEQTRQTFERNLEERVNSARSKEAFSARIQLEQVQATVRRLRNSQSTGRIVLSFMRDDFVGSEADLVLESGDALSIPRTASTVLVQGHVFNPTAVLFKDGIDADTLIDLAGGVTETADTRRIYVMRADGYVASVQSESGRFRLSDALLPGDVVLVPARPLGRDAGSVALDLLLLARSAGEAGALWNLATSELDDGSLSIIDSPASPRHDSAPPAEILREFQR